ncbi:unnamed protein product [Pseudo-nitzschia multistriata]|uniref:ATP-dependent DNA helicase n=1 Tax=Pseudo-nitzschia multistriata TaxID=183589 RepID=A0A448ZDD1_9STRA|nr:unnamed protein product [Pseudo-nitzschia multistriata]
MSASERITHAHTHHNPYAKRRRGGGCYAVANQCSSSSSSCAAVASGIYFSYDEAKQQIVESRRASLSSLASDAGVKFQRFDKVSDAELFLHERGFVPTIESGGWISARDRSPILYEYSLAKQAANNSNKSSSGKGSSSHPTVRVTPTSNLINTNSEAVSQRLWPNNEHQREHVHATDHSRYQQQHQDQHQHQQHPYIHSTQPVISIDSSPESSLPPAAAACSSYFQQKELVVSPSRKRQKRRRPRSNSNSESSSISVLDDDEFDFYDRQQHDSKPTAKGENSKHGENRDENTSTSTPDVQCQACPEFDIVQQRAIDAALIGKNVFLTGVAGTGKSLVTKRIVEDAKCMRKEVAVAAPTGVAAVNLGPELGAQTVHSLAGVGVPQTASGFEKMLSPWTAKKWKKIEVLVLDEIGMLGADFLDWMDVYVRKARKKPLEPFGGIQLIFVGDFAQLGPIPGRGHSLRNKAFEPDQPGADCLMGVSECAAYAFQTVLWREADFHHVHLRKVYRQKNKDFQLALMDIREARADSRRVKTLVDICLSPLDDREGLEIPEGIKPTILYCTNRNVDKENFENLRKLSDRGKTFEATDHTSISSDVNLAGRDAVGRLLKNNAFFKDCSASKQIHLKVGAQVMLLQNLDIKQGLVNGSRGVVEKFALCPVVKDIIHGQEQLIGPGDIDKFPGCRFEDLKFNQKTDFEGKIWYEKIAANEKSFLLYRICYSISFCVVTDVRAPIRGSF